MYLIVNTERLKRCEHMTSRIKRQWQAEIRPFTLELSISAGLRPPLRLIGNSWLRSFTPKDKNWRQLRLQAAVFRDAAKSGLRPRQMLELQQLRNRDISPV